MRFYFENDEDLSNLGGHTYLARLATNAVTIINARHYGQTIHDLFLRRQLIDLGEDTVNEAFTPEIEDSALDQIERAEKRLYELATIGDYQGGFIEFPAVLTAAVEMAEAAYKRDGKLTGVSTGLTDLDDLLGGFRGALQMKEHQSHQRMLLLNYSANLMQIHKNGFGVLQII